MQRSLVISYLAALAVGCACGLVKAEPVCGPEVYAGSSAKQLIAMQNQKVCESGVRGLGRNMSPKLFGRLALASSLIANEGGGSVENITFQLASIIRLRGQVGNFDAANSSIETSWKIFHGLNGRLPLSEVVAFLKNAPGLAKTISDDGLIDMAALMVNYKH